MTQSPEISPLPARKLPQSGSFFPPAGLSDLALVRALAAVSADLASPAIPPIPFQRRNARFLLRAVKILSAMFEFLCDSPPRCLPPAANTCFRELYVLLHRSKLVLDYSANSTRLWLLLNNARISGHFHELAQEIATLLDVLPVKELALDIDLCEQLELLHSQTRRSTLYVDPAGEAIRLRISAFLEDFDKGQPPDPSHLRQTFVDCLGIRDASSCRSEIEFLEERICAQEDDLDPTIIYGVVALARYARFSLFEMAGGGRSSGGGGAAAPHLRKSSSVVAQMLPKDFCCPISLELMRDPVIVSTGQTYDRVSIAQWLEEGHRTCPNSGQALAHTRLVPNRALKNLISQWCVANAIPYDAPPAGDGSGESSISRAITRAAVAANRATARLLVEQLSHGSELAVAESARELRVLARAGKENRLCVGEEGAVPPLRQLLQSPNSDAQVHAVTAILNLSLLDCNKARIVEEPGCLTSIVEVLRNGLTTEARENSAAVLFSLSSVHEYKLLIAGEEGALEALAALLADGTQGGKKDVVAALFNVSTHAETCTRMLQSRAVVALVTALGTELVAEQAAGALALLARRPSGAEALSRDYRALSALVGIMKRGSPRGKEHAVAALLEMCRTGGAAAEERVARVPALGSIIQTIMFTGTKRAKRKAASLNRFCRRSIPPPHGGGGWALPQSTIVGRASGNSSSRVGAEFSTVVDSTTAVPAM